MEFVMNRRIRMKTGAQAAQDRPENDEQPTGNRRARDGWQAPAGRLRACFSSARLHQFLERNLNNLKSEDNIPRKSVK